MGFFERGSRRWGWGVEGCGGGIGGGTYLLIILNVFKVVLSEGKLILAGELICRFLRCFKFRKKLSSEPSKEKKQYVLKKASCNQTHYRKSFSYVS